MSSIRSNTLGLVLMKFRASCFAYVPQFMTVKQLEANNKVTENFISVVKVFERIDCLSSYTVKMHCY